LRNQDNLATAEPDPCRGVLNGNIKSETEARIGAHNVLHEGIAILTFNVLWKEDN